jgi:hypothetical protein
MVMRYVQFISYSTLEPMERVSLGFPTKSYKVNWLRYRSLIMPVVHGLSCNPAMCVDAGGIARGINRRAPGSLEPLQRHRYNN